MRPETRGMHRGVRGSCCYSLGNKRTKFRFIFFSKLPQDLPDDFVTSIWVLCLSSPGREVRGNAWRGDRWSLRQRPHCLMAWSSGWFWVKGHPDCTFSPFKLKAATGTYSKLTWAIETSMQCCYRTLTNLSRFDPCYSQHKLTGVFF